MMPVATGHNSARPRRTTKIPEFPCLSRRKIQPGRHPARGGLAAREMESSGLRRRLFRGFFQIFFRSDGERLNGNRDDALLLRRRDLCGRGKSGAQSIGWISNVTTTLKSLAS